MKYVANEHFADSFSLNVVNCKSARLHVSVLVLTALCSLFISVFELTICHTVLVWITLMYGLMRTHTHTHTHTHSMFGQNQRDRQQSRPPSHLVVHLCCDDMMLDYCRPLSLSLSQSVSRSLYLSEGKLKWFTERCLFIRVWPSTHPSLHRTTADQHRCFLHVSADFLTVIIRQLLTL